MSVFTRDRCGLRPDLSREGGRRSGEDPESEDAGCELGDDAEEAGDPVGVPTSVDAMDRWDRFSRTSQKKLEHFISKRVHGNANV